MTLWTQFFFYQTIHLLLNIRIWIWLTIADQRGAQKRYNLTICSFDHKKFKIVTLCCPIRTFSLHIAYYIYIYVGNFLTTINLTFPMHWQSTAGRRVLFVPYHKIDNFCKLEGKDAEKGGYLSFLKKGQNVPAANDKNFATVVSDKEQEHPFHYSITIVSTCHQGSVYHHW